jgi:hypothetical protein
MRLFLLAWLKKQLGFHSATCSSIVKLIEAVTISQIFFPKQGLFAEFLYMSNEAATGAAVEQGSARFGSLTPSVAKTQMDTISFTITV